MEPSRVNHGTLLDLLDRVLDKGLVINADIIISLAGVPLIGVNLRAALAGMETMVQYGLMRDWDEGTRAQTRDRREKKPATVWGEGTILDMRGAYYHSQGIRTAWRVGRICLTDSRLILYHPTLEGVLFQTPLERIAALSMEGDEYLRGDERSDLCLLLDGDHMVRLRAPDAGKLRDAIEGRIAAPDKPRLTPRQEKDGELWLR